MCWPGLPGSPRLIPPRLNSYREWWRFSLASTYTTLIRTTAPRSEIGRLWPSTKCATRVSLWQPLRRWMSAPLSKLWSSLRLRTRNCPQRLPQRATSRRAACHSQGRSRKRCCFCLRRHAACAWRRASPAAVARSLPLRSKEAQKTGDHEGIIRQPQRNRFILTAAAIQHALGEGHRTLAARLRWHRCQAQALRQKSSHSCAPPPQPCGPLRGACSA